MKLTAIGQEILIILKSTDKPVCAKTIKEHFTLSADLSNVYRNLNSLELNKVIGSISFKGIKFYYASEDKNGHFIMCRNCGEIQSFHSCHEHFLQKQLEKEFGYTLTGHNLYFEGYCKSCSQELKKQEFKGEKKL